MKRRGLRKNEGRSDALAHVLLHDILHNSISRDTQFLLALNTTIAHIQGLSSWYVLFFSIKIFRG